MTAPCPLCGEPLVLLRNTHVCGPPSRPHCLVHDEGLDLQTCTCSGLPPPPPREGLPPWDSNDPDAGKKAIAYLKAALAHYAAELAREGSRRPPEVESPSVSLAALLREARNFVALQAGRNPVPYNLDVLTRIDAALGEAAGAERCPKCASEEVSRLCDNCSHAWRAAGAERGGEGR